MQEKKVNNFRNRSRNRSHFSQPFPKDMEMDGKKFSVAVFGVLQKNH